MLRVTQRFALGTRRRFTTYPYTSIMADEDTVLEEAMDNLKEAGQRIRATQSLLRSQGMTEGEGIITFVDGVLEEMESAYRYLDNEESDD
jgi:hypothetical protein